MSINIDTIALNIIRINQLLNILDPKNNISQNKNNTNTHEMHHYTDTQNNTQHNTQYKSSSRNDYLSLSLMNL
jgi:hypothetical protein